MTTAAWWPSCSSGGQPAGHGLADQRNLGMPGGHVALKPFGRIAAWVMADLDREARDVERFFATI